MKKTIFLLLLVSAPSLFSQNTFSYFGGGYTYGGTSISGLNYVVDRYNETRSWLSEKMEHISALKGTSFTAGFFVDPILFEITYENRKGTASASGNDASDNLITRDLDLLLTSWSFGFSAVVSESRALLTSLGISADIGSLSVETKTTNTANTQVLDEMIVGMSLYAPVLYSPIADFPIFLKIQPYVQYYFSTDFSSVSAGINPNTYSNDDTEKSKSGILNYGITGQILLSF